MFKLASGQIFLESINFNLTHGLTATPKAKLPPFFLMPNVKYSFHYGSLFIF